MICHPKMVPGLVTVIVPFFNREQYLAQTIRSILNQSHESLELILVDDGSSDSSFSVVQSFPDPRIRCVQLIKRSGKSAALNQVLPLARGEWLTFFDSDDIMTRDSLKARIEFFEKNPKALSVIGRIGRLIDDQGKTVSKTHPLNQYLRDSLRVTRQLAQSIGSLIPELFTYENCPLGPLNAALLRRELVEQIGWFRENFAPWEDREYMIRAAVRQPVQFLDRAVIWYRVHDSNLSFKIVNGKLKRRSNLRLEIRYKKHCVNLIGG